MRKILVLVVVFVASACAPTWEESCSSYCDWAWRCGGPAVIPSVGACEAQFCADGQDRYGPCWYEVWDYMDCIGNSTCTGTDECRALLGPCDPD